jgi:hypothetical protein
MSELYAEDLAIGRALNATRDPAEMRSLITCRKLVRAGLEFEHVTRQYERRRPVPTIFDRPIVICGGLGYVHDN